MTQFIWGKGGEDEGRALGWSASVQIVAGRPVIRLTFRGGGELRAECVTGRWVVVSGSEGGWALLDRLIQEGVVAARASNDGRKAAAYHLSLAVIAAALDP